VEDEKAKGFVQLMQRSVRRMAGLIEDVLDFARGRLGGGLALERELKPIEPTLIQVIDELRATWPDRTIEADLDLAGPFDCDHVRLGQLLSILVANAVTHGADDAPIRVRAVTSAAGLELSVANAGDPIPPAAMERLFQPFYRQQLRPSLQGLGLGLYIAAEIARGHGGTLAVASSPEETRFTLRMPATDL